MARFVVSAVVAAVAFVASGFNPAVAFQAFALTYGLTGFLDPAQKVSGPRIDDLKGTTAEYGTPISPVYGHPRVAGAIVWCSDKLPIANTEEAGGKGGPSTEVTTYTYEQDVRILLTANQIIGVRRIWSNGKLIWSIADDSDADTLDASVATNAWRRMTVYTGAADQMPDPTEEAALGIANCPAYRGRGSVFIEGLNLGGSGYLPNLTFEVVRVGDYEALNGDGLLCHLDAAADGYVTSALGPDMQQVGGAYLDDADEMVDGAYGTGTGASSFTASGITGNLTGRAWRVDVSFRPSQDFNYDIIELDRPDDSPNYKVKLGRGIFLSALVSEFVTDGASGGGGVGSNVNAPIVGALNHLAIQYSPTGGPGVAGVIFAFLNGTRIGGITGTGELFGDSGPTFTRLTLKQSNLTQFDEVYFRYDPEELYGETYDIPGVFSASNLLTLTAGDEPLDDVLTDIALRAGLEPSYLNFASCSSQYVKALAVSQVTSSRSVMELLAAAYLQEFVESDTLKTVARGGAALTAIPYADMGASLADTPEPLPLRRLNDVELPAQVAITYINVLNDYQKGTEYSDRLLGVSTGVSASELALGLTPQEAKRIADVRLTDAVASIVQAGPVGLLKEYVHLEPCDVVPLIGHDGSTYRARILKLTVDQGVHTLECVLDDATVINSAALTDEDYTSSTIVRALADSLLELLDIPILRDADSNAGIYAAVTRSTLDGDWPGAALYRGVDDAAWSEVARYTDRTFIGTTDTALGAWNGRHCFDEVNTVTVSGIGTLQSYTRAAILNGTANAYLIGDEIIYARNASMLAEGMYLLSGLLRARRGTEVEALAGHSSGTRCVLLQNAGLRRVSFDQGQLGAEFDFRAVTLGHTIASADTESITPMGVGLRPFSPVHLRAEDNGDGTFDLSWTRRTRERTRFTGAAGIYAPLGEASEAYVVRVYDGFDVLQSTQTVTTDSATVTAAAGHTVSVYQVGAVAGRETEKVL